MPRLNVDDRLTRLKFVIDLPYGCINRYLNNGLELKDGPIALERVFPSDPERRGISTKKTTADARRYEVGYED